MALLRDSLVAWLAAAGLISILYLALGGIFGRAEELPTRVYLLLPVSEKTKDMEQAAHMLQRFRRIYGGGARAVILDCGMGEEQRRMAGILQREDPLLEVVQEAELPKKIREHAKE